MVLVDIVFENLQKADPIISSQWAHNESAMSLQHRTFVAVSLQQCLRFILMLHQYNVAER